MKTTNEKPEISKYQDMNDFAFLLIDNGYTVISPLSPSSYFHFFKDGAIE